MSDKKTLGNRAYDYMVQHNELTENSSSTEFWEMHKDLILELEGAVADRLLEWRDKRRIEVAERETDKALDTWATTEECRADVLRTDQGSRGAQVREHAVRDADLHRATRARRAVQGLGARSAAAVQHRTAFRRG